eukprot:CAMPEP_0196594334 /NCGR_PEP_ID=MMETSP1081-20130531/78045_1 /TAXON_ID=36882 /ORGANISM="Pyramimonas amylifera, Strain CCMP720" /LENGTH=362 /DNA_ID=CAMNT_0041918573 /DNA_START=157 /DNA_END=1245 /DNA_ORIENTATION=+
MSRNDPGHPQCKSSLGCTLAEHAEHAEHAKAYKIHKRPKYEPTHISSNTNGKPVETRLPRRFWKDMTMEEFRAMDAEKCIAILPTAAIEQHGPHLPVSVDATLNEGVLSRALELLPEEVPVCVLPMMPVGKSNEHIGFPGTLSLSTNTLISLWTDIGESVARAGVKKLILFNSHGGQPQVMDIVARDLRVRFDMFVVTLNWFSFGVPEGMFSVDELKHGIHGGAVETSMMLHLQEHLVHPQHFQNFAPTSIEWEQEYTMLSPEGAVGFGWQAQDLHQSGAMGDATLASKEKGGEILEFAAEKLVMLLHEVDKFPLSNLKQGPLDMKSDKVDTMSATKPKVTRVGEEKITNTRKMEGEELVEV